MRIRRHIAVAIGAAVWMAAAGARADIRLATLQMGWQAPSIDRFVPDAGEAVRGRPELLAQWGALPPEQRQQMRQQMREHWQQMPPERREERRQEYRDRWQQLPSDERQRIRDEMRERGTYGGGHRGRGDGR